VTPKYFEFVNKLKTAERRPCSHVATSHDDT